MFQYPDAHGTDADMLDAGPVADVAAAAEHAGFMGFSFTEHPAPGARWLASGGHQTLDPFVALGHVAAVTSRMRLLTYLAVAPYRNPLLLAKAAASVDKLSGGRFILGLGTGYLKSEFHALGVDFEDRNALFDEALDALALHWSGEPFTYKGRHFDAREVIGRPLPVQRPIPIWIGGNSQAARRRVAERAQGWMPLLGPPTLHATARTPQLDGLDGIAAAIAEIRDAAAPRGVTVDLLVPYLDPSIGFPEKDVERHREALAGLESIGATWVVVSSGTHTPDATRAFLEGFGANYITART